STHWCESQFSIRKPVFALRLQRPPRVNHGGFFCFKAAAAAYWPSQVPFTSVHGERIESRRKPQSNSRRINACAVRYFFWSGSVGKRRGPQNAPVSPLVAAERPACASTSSRRCRSGTKEPRPRMGCELAGAS